jgi:hypothetical protein
MVDVRVREELNAAIEDAAKGADPAISSLKVAEEFYESRPDLIEPFVREWVVEKLVFKIRRERAKLRSPGDSQLLLGFAVPKKIEIKSGDRIPLAQATLSRIREYRALVWKQKRAGKDPEVEKLDAVISFLRPYARKHPGITYAEAVALASKTKRKVAAS